MISCWFNATINVALLDYLGRLGIINSIEELHRENPVNREYCIGIRRTAQAHGLTLGSPSTNWSLEWAPSAKRLPWLIQRRKQYLVSSTRTIPKDFPVKSRDARVCWGTLRLVEPVLLQTGFHRLDLVRHICMITNGCLSKELVMCFLW